MFQNNTSYLTHSLQVKPCHMCLFLRSKGLERDKSSMYICSLLHLMHNTAYNGCSCAQRNKTPSPGTLQRKVLLSIGKYCIIHNTYMILHCVGYILMYSTIFVSNEA